MENGSKNYDVFAALNAAKQESSARDVEQGRVKKPEKIEYTKVLEFVQNKISNTPEHNKVLAQTIDTDSGYEQLKNIIYTVMQSYPIPLTEKQIVDFRSRIFDDMTGIGILTKYVDDPNIEEINIYGPGPKQIEVIDGNGSHMLNEGFKDCEEVLSITKRMVRKGKAIIDEKTPRVDSYMDGGTRVSAMIPPIVRDDKGAVVSIRKQTKANITKEALIRSYTGLEEEFELIELCFNNKVSGAIVGATGSGKTTLLNYFLSQYVKNAMEASRVYIIEESRELQLPSDARVFYTAVSGDEHSANYISADALLKSALRFHPTFITCAEMRGAEAMNAMTAAQTGHVVWSTLHCDSCEESYQRLLTMCKMSGTDLSETLLLRNLIKAFPILVSAQQMRDGTRKITGIYEATDVEGINIIGHYLYKLQISHFEFDGNGRVKKVHGKHQKVGYLSDRMAQHIFDNCGNFELVHKFASPDWRPESMDEHMKNNNEQDDMPLPEIHKLKAAVTPEPDKTPEKPTFDKAFARHEPEPTRQPEQPHTEDNPAPMAEQQDDRAEIPYTPVPPVAPPPADTFAQETPHQAPPIPRPQVPYSGQPYPRQQQPQGQGRPMQQPAMAPRPAPQQRPSDNRPPVMPGQPNQTQGPAGQPRPAAQQQRPPQGYPQGYQPQQRPAGQPRPQNAPAQQPPQNNGYQPRPTPQQGQRAQYPPQMQRPQQPASQDQAMNRQVQSGQMPPQMQQPPRQQFRQPQNAPMRPMQRPQQERTDYREMSPDEF